MPGRVGNTLLDAMVYNMMNNRANSLTIYSFISPLISLKRYIFEKNTPFLNKRKKKFEPLEARCQASIVLYFMKNFQVGGVSTTGHGESITKACLAYTAVINMEQGNFCIIF